MTFSTQSLTGLSLMHVTLRTEYVDIVNSSLCHFTALVTSVGGIFYGLQYSQRLVNSIFLNHALKRADLALGLHSQS